MLRHVVLLQVGELPAEEEEEGGGGEIEGEEGGVSQRAEKGEMGRQHFPCSGAMANLQLATSSPHTACKGHKEYGVCIRYTYDVRRNTARIYGCRGMDCMHACACMIGMWAHMHACMHACMCAQMLCFLS
jgi:hypothetical protein